MFVYLHSEYFNVKKKSHFILSLKIQRLVITFQIQFQNIQEFWVFF